MAYYDPEEYGARCRECPLRLRRVGLPVPPEWNEGAVALAIGANPGPEETKKGRPFVGPAGLEFMRALASVGVARRRLCISNAILCCPPGAPRGALERFNHELQKENKERVKEGLEPVITPMEACRPRLLNEVKALPSLITLGGTALHAVTGRAISVMEARGGPREVMIGDVFDDGGEGGRRAPGSSPLTPVRLLPTLHPSFILSSRRWAGAFRADLGRAFRWFTSGLSWKEPQVLYRPTPAQFSRFLQSIRSDPFSVFDVETFPGFREQDHYDPMYDVLKCFGIGVARGLACVIPFRSVEGGGISFYMENEKPQIVSLIKEYLTSPLWKKAGWNSGYYDHMVVKYRLGAIAKPHLDGMVLSRLAEPELPHNLGFAGSIYTDVDKWKAGHTAVNAASDQELWIYNAKDTVVTAMAIPALAAVVKERKQDHLVSIFAKNEATCVGLHENGMYVDQNKRREWDRKLLWQANLERRKIRELASGFGASRDLNPASFPQLADLLFGKLGIAPYRYTDLGDPSTDDDSLRAFLSETWGLDQKRRALVSSIRDFRRVTKRRGVVVRLRPITEDYYEEPFLVDLEESPEEREERERRIKKGKSGRAPGLVLPDGRVHGDWLFQGTAGWRFSSSNPNCFDAETEILTPRGWVKFPDLKCTDQVAQWESGSITFVTPISMIEKKFTGRMVSIQNLHINLRVTADHRCLLRHRKTKEERVFAAEEYPSDWQQIHSGWYSGPGLGLSADEITVICAMQADGTWDGKNKNPGMSFRFVKDRKIVRLRAALDRLGATYSVSERVENTQFKDNVRKVGIRVGSSPLATKIRSILGKEKVFGPWILQASGVELDQFADEVWHWDGCITRMNHYSSSVKINADMIQAVQALRGWRAKIRIYTPSSGRPNYQVDVTRRDYSLTTNVSKKFESVSNEIVYCVSVPSTFVIIRRQGCVMITGQCQNVTDVLRDMFTAAPGHVLVGCDEAQLELRMVAGMAGCRYYLDSFKSGGDPHKALCIDTFGARFEQAGKDQQKKLRRSVKELTYAGLYAASDETKLEVVTSAEEEDEAGTVRLIFPDFTLREVNAFSQNWHRRNPEIEVWWERVIEKWRRDHFLAEPILGLKRDFLDGEDRNELLNYEAQSGGSALVHLATFKALDEFPFFKYGPGTGLMQQGHDSLVFEVPVEHERWKDRQDTKENPIEREFGYCEPGCKCLANRTARMLQDSMAADGRQYGLDVNFIGEAKIGLTWKAV